MLFICKAGQVRWRGLTFDCTEAGRFARKLIRPTVIRPKWTMFRPIVIDVSPDVSESMKIGIEILIFFLSDLPSTLSGDRTYVAPQSYTLK